MKTPFLDRESNNRVSPRTTETFPPYPSPDQQAVSTEEKEKYLLISLLEKVPLGMFLIQRGRFCAANSLFAKMLGYDNPLQVIGKSLWDFINPDDRGHVKLAGTEKNNRGIFGTLPVFRITRKDGTFLWLVSGGLPTTFRGKPAFMGHFIDLTELKEKEWTLNKSLERYQTIINEIEDAVAEVDLNGTITFTNDTGCRIWGHTREEAIGRNYRSYVDEKTAERIYLAYNKVFKTGIPGKNIVYEIIRKNDGGRRIVEDYVTLIRNADGRVTGFRVVNRDITDRKKVEKELAEHRTRLEAIFRSVKDGIITVDPELRVIEANKSTEIICGLPVKEITGKILPDCLNRCNKACSEILNKTLEKRTTVKEYRIECGHQQRLQQTVSLTSSPLLDPEGHFMGAVMVIRDITLLRDLERELRERHQFQNIIGRSKKMQDIYNLLEDLANLETTVLITGESGTGKELVARALHYSGRRTLKPFVTVNCSALAESLLESELFGHVKGAFTGAIRDKQGRFQAANGGTILLDEIGDISPLIQLKLLRVLQEKVVERVGESTPRKVDVRVIASTNKDLKEKVKRGEFRQDLYYRLKVVEVSLPPLRDRLEDLPLLVDHFCQFFNERFKKNIEGISNEVLGLFMSYPWPGNVRELEHVLEHAFVLCRVGIITPDHLPAEIRDYEKTEKLTISKNQKKERIQAKEIRDALSKTGGNKAKAARLLGIGRRTIYRRIEQYPFLTEN